MRPGQNKRMRGRNNNNNNSNRKGPNPLTRSYESNGPDVKIRGTAHHVAEKYLQLARDAQTSGDPVAAESYLQHAEHYFRLIASAQQAQAGYMRSADEPDPDETDDEDGVPDRFASPLERPQPQPQYTQPQPSSYGDRPYSGERQNAPGGERQPYVNGDRPQFGERQERQPDRQQERQPDRGGYEGNRRNDRTGRAPRPYREQDGRPQDNRAQDGRGQDYRGQDQRGPEYRGQERTDRQPEFKPNDHRDVRAADPVPDTATRTEVPQHNAPAEVISRAPEPVQRPVEGVPRQTEFVPRQPEPVQRDLPLRDTAPRDAAPREPAARELVAREPASRDPAPAEAPGLPAFITGPVRASAMVAAPEAAGEAAGSAPEGTTEIPAEDAPRFPPRRRRRTRAAVASEAADAPVVAPVSNE